MDGQALRRSGTLEPPRKSIELEDSGAHDLEASETEDDIFSDAQESHSSHTDANALIPITRVEKVDDHENYGEVPGTAAYKMRIQDAVPDELEIIPDGGESKHSPGHIHPDTSPAAATKPIPKTVVQKVIPATPSHGEVPGTAAHSIRKADAVPDVVVQVTDPDFSSFQAHSKSNPAVGSVLETTNAGQESISSNNGGVGEAGSNTRSGFEGLDSEEGESEIPDLPTSSFNRSTFSPAANSRSLTEVFSIAEDGGFGPMRGEMAETASIETDNDLPIHGEPGQENEEGEDFDDFEAGAGDDDFGDFDDGLQLSSFPADRSSDTPNVANTKQPIYPSISPFPLLDFSQIDSTEDLVSASAPYLDKIFPTTQTPPSASSASTPESYPIFLTDRSLSLWSQLVAPPPLQPPNWVRSRIRRLFLVSLGVPVDLDEILPASKQKKLVLPSTDLHNDSRSSSKGGQDGSRAKFRQDNTSTASVDQPSSQRANRRRKGPALPPELDLGRTKLLCMTTEAALSNFLDSELGAHIRALEELTVRASEVLEYWLKRKDNALGDKEAFEGVIENLVKHARRVRK